MIHLFSTKRASTLLALGITATTGAQTFQQAADSAKADLEQALRELSALEKRIAEEKLPLARQLNDLEDQVIAKRRDHDEALSLQDRKSVDLNKLKDEVKTYRDQNDYLRKTLLEEYVRRLETRVHASERPIYQAAIKEAREANDNPHVDTGEVFGKQIIVIRAAIDRLGRLLGGDTYDGQVMTPEGVPASGRFAMVGPVVVFSGNGSDGLASLQRGSIEAVVTDIGEKHRAGIRALTRGAGNLPLDTTQGDALKIQLIKETWWEHINKGGVVIWPLLALGLTALIVAAVKFMQLSTLRRARTPELQAILDQLRGSNTPGALALAKRIKGPAGELLQTAVEHADEKKELIEEALYEKMLHTKPKLERMMPFIALTAAISPLLGLLGTVTGMINTFKLIEVHGTGDPKQLSAGISEALVTTEYGLIIAVPCLLLHALLSRKAKGILASMEQTSVGFINGLPNKA